MADARPRPRQNQSVRKPVRAAQRQTITDVHEQPFLRKKRGPRARWPRLLVRPLRVPRVRAGQSWRPNPGGNGLLAQAARVWLGQAQLTAERMPLLPIPQAML